MLVIGAPSHPRQRDLYAEATTRLGRPLKHGELHIDLAADDATLAAGKQALFDTIEKEKRRAIRSWLRGRHGWGMQVTPAMLDVLTGLYAQGAAAAEKELRSLGITPRKPVRVQRAYDATTLAYKTWGTHVAIGKSDGLQRNLDWMTDRIEREGRTIVGKADTLGNLGALGREMERAVPGSLNAASQLVSAGFFNGMGGVYENHADLFQSWMYSAVMDASTCDECEAADGTEYATWDEAQDDLPDGGPNPNCYGEGRCRCRLVPGETNQSAVDQSNADEAGLVADGMADDPLIGVHPTDTLQQRLLAHWTETAAEYADERGITIEEYLRRVDDHLLKLVEGRAMQIRAPASAAENIIYQGRFKSQFETRSSRGMFDPAYRADSEHDMFSYDHELPDHLRPIYGYLQSEMHGADGYGDVIFVLKQEVRHRTTVTFADSLDNNIIPSRLTRPNFLSAERIDPLSESRLEYVQKMYTELQFHGGVSIADIDEVLLPWQYDPGTPSDPFYALEKRLDKAGIKWRTMKRDEKR